MAYFNHHASCIQRFYKGYWSRKFICDYYARTTFIVSSVFAGKQMMSLFSMDFTLRTQELAKRRFEEEEAKRKADVQSVIYKK